MRQSYCHPVLSSILKRLLLGSVIQPADLKNSFLFKVYENRKWANMPDTWWAEVTYSHTLVTYRCSGWRTTDILGSTHSDPPQLQHRGAHITFPCPSPNFTHSWQPCSPQPAPLVLAVKFQKNAPAYQHCSLQLIDRSTEQTAGFTDSLFWEVSVPKVWSLDKSRWLNARWKQRWFLNILYQAYPKEDRDTQVYLLPEADSRSIAPGDLNTLACIMLRCTA